MSHAPARVDLLATYLARLPSSQTAARSLADGFALGQSLGTWRPVPGITQEMRDRHGASVTELRQASDGESVAGEDATGSWVLRVAFPISNLGRSLAMLLTTTMGNDPSTSIAMRLVDLDIPADYARAHRGPRFGVRGWRTAAGVVDRPILLNMIKPCTGYAPEVGATFVAHSALAGVDLIKDDELLADPEFSEVEARTRAYVAAIDGVAARTGQRPGYIAHVTTRPARLVAAAQAAVAAGAVGVMVTPLTLGLDSLAELSEAGLGVPIFAHTAGIEYMTGAGISGFGVAAIARLLRLAGADAILLSSPHAPRPMREATYRAALAATSDPMAGLIESMAVIGGGITAAHVPAIVAAAGPDAMIAVGGAIQGHPDGPEAGGREVRAAIAAAMRARADTPALPPVAGRTA